MSSVVALTNASGGTFANPVLLVRANGTTGQMTLAQANTAPNAAGIAGVCLNAPVNAALGDVVVSGPCWVQCTGAITPGAKVYLSSATAGQGSPTPGTVSVVVGTCLAASGTLALICLVANADGLAPSFSLTNESVVISAGGAALTEDHANFYYRYDRARFHSLGQSVFGGPSGSYGAGTPLNPALTFGSEFYPDPTDSTSGYPRDTGFFGIADGHVGFSNDGAPAHAWMSMGFYTYALQARYLYGGTENGRTDASPLVIYGGSDDALTGLQFRATSVFNATSGTQYGARFNYLGSAGGFAPASGTAKWNAVGIDYEVNQTGGANGRMVGLNIEATKTAVVGAHFGIRVGDATISAFRSDPGAIAGNTFIYVGEASTGITGAAGLSAETNARSALWYLDNAANAWQSNRSIWGIAGTAASPSYAFSTAQTTGMYLYAAGQLGFATDGRYVFNLFSNATSRYLTIGEMGSGITGFVQATWQSNVRQAYIYLDDSAGNYLTANPNFAVSGLSAGGLVKANATTGLLALATGADVNTALGLTGPAVVFTNASGVLTVDTANFVYDNATDRLSVTGGVIAGAGSATTAAYSAGAANVGTYRYAANILGVTAGGYVALFAKVGTGNYFTVGELSSGITAAQVAFQTNAFTAFLLLNASDGNLIQVSPNLAVHGLSAGGLVKATTTLGTLALATGADVNTALGLTGPAVVFTNGSGVLTVDTTNFVFDNATDRLSVTGGVAAGAGSATTAAFAAGAGNVGIYRRATDILGVTAGGYVAHFGKVSNNIYFTLGELSTSIAWAQITWQTNLRTAYIYVDDSVGNVLIYSVGVLLPAGSFSAPAYAFTAEPSIGMYRAASGVVGLSGKVLVGTGTASTIGILTVYPTGGDDRIDFILGGGGYTVADNSSSNLFQITHGGINLAKATTPSGSQLTGTIFTRPTYIAVGAGTSARLSPGSATVRIEAEPLLSGTWTTTSVPWSLYVASGPTCVNGTFAVGDRQQGMLPALEGTPDATNPLLGFFGYAPSGKAAVTGSRGGNAALASLITILATYGLVGDLST
jgi:hypothetical protein